MEPFGKATSRLLKAMHSELGILTTFWILATRRQSMPAHAIALPHGAETRPVRAVLVFLAAIEMPLADLVASRLLGADDFLRGLVFALSVYLLVWIIGFALIPRAYPHYITQTAAIFRFCNWQRVEISLRDIESVRVAQTDCRSRKILSLEGDTLQLNNAMGTNNLLITLRQGSKPLINSAPANDPIRFFSCEADNPHTVCDFIESRTISWDTAPGAVSQSS